MEGGRTDHAWVRLDENTLKLWKGVNGDGLLLKKLENVFLVERYRRKDGSQDLGLALPTETWVLASFSLGLLKSLKRDSRAKSAIAALDLLAQFEHYTKYLPHFSSLDSKVSVKTALTRVASEATAHKAALLYRAAREAGMKKKGGQKRGPKPGRGF